MEIEDFNPKKLEATYWAALEKQYYEMLEKYNPDAVKELAIYKIKYNELQKKYDELEKKYNEAKEQNNGK